MKNYRLKPEAVQFFQEKYATRILPYDTWESIGVDVKALEEIQDTYLTYGHQDKDNKGASLAGWGNEKGSCFYFTLHFPSSKMKDHDEFTNGKTLRKLMDLIQENTDCFFKGFSKD